MGALSYEELSRFLQEPIRIKFENSTGYVARAVKIL
jgi:hypothetical protein